MARFVEDVFYRIYISALLLLKPAVLFHRINQLPWYQQTLHSWVDQLGYGKDISILEAGCGTGALTSHMARNGALVHGIDKSPGMVQLARKENIHGAEFTQASALDMSFDNDRFDFVIAASLLNVVDEPEALLKEMVRVCKPGGKVSVLVPQTDVSIQTISHLADKLGLTGFSRAALLAWHRRAPKMQKEKVLGLMDQVGLKEICTEALLDGMILTATGTK